MHAVVLLKLHADYNAWFNARLLDAAQRLSPDEREQDLGAFFGSVDGTLNHLLIGDSIWLRRFSQAEGPAAEFLRHHLDSLCPDSPLDSIVARGQDAIRVHREALDATISGWAGELDDPQLEQLLPYRNTAGRPFSRRLGPLALHFFNHQTHHRGQLTALLFQCGVDIGVTDLLTRIPDEL